MKNNNKTNDYYKKIHRVNISRKYLKSGNAHRLIGYRYNKNHNDDFSDSKDNSNEFI
jgi:hypothetical protein